MGPTYVQPQCSSEKVFCGKTSSSSLCDIDLYSQKFNGRLVTSGSTYSILECDDHVSASLSNSKETKQLSAFSSVSTTTSNDDVSNVNFLEETSNSDCNEIFALTPNDFHVAASFKNNFNGCANDESASRVHLLTKLNPFSTKPLESQILSAVSHLSRECLEEDAVKLMRSALSKCTTKKDISNNNWALHVLIKHAATSHETFQVLGFVCFCIRMRMRSIEIAKVAVHHQYRYQGYGRKLVMGVLDMAKNRQNIDFVCLSSLASSIAFYSRLGFDRFDSIPVGTRALQSNEELVPGQVYMEFKTQHRENKGNIGTNKQRILFNMNKNRRSKRA